MSNVSMQVEPARLSGKLILSLSCSLVDFSNRRVSLELLSFSMSFHRASLLKAPAEHQHLTSRWHLTGTSLASHWSIGDSPASKSGSLISRELWFISEKVIAKVSGVFLPGTSSHKLPQAVKGESVYENFSLALELYTARDCAHFANTKTHK